MASIYYSRQLVEGAPNLTSTIRTPIPNITPVTVSGEFNRKGAIVLLNLNLGFAVSNSGSSSFSVGFMNSGETEFSTTQFTSYGNSPLGAMVNITTCDQLTGPGDETYTPVWYLNPGAATIILLSVPVVVSFSAIVYPANANVYKKLKQ